MIKDYFLRLFKVSFLLWIVLTIGVSLSSILYVVLNTSLATSLIALITLLILGFGLIPKSLLKFEGKMYLLSTTKDETANISYNTELQDGQDKNEQSEPLEQHKVPISGRAQEWNYSNLALQREQSTVLTLEKEEKQLHKQIILPIGSIVRNVNGDRYTVEELLGKRGSSTVYLVQDRRNKQDRFALKELISPDKVVRDRFAFEAEVLMHLDHESLPHVYRVFENERLKRIYILMDYIEGQDLEALRKEQPNQRFTLQFVFALLTPIVSALSYLHHSDPPIVHRDIKPSNIVIPIKGGDAVLVDFGIAKEYKNDGTPAYAALEQYGGGTNIRTDVYGLGATLYTLLTGTIPVDALTRVSDSQNVDPLKPAHELVPSLPIGVSEAISHAMSTAQNDRFATIDEFWTEVNVAIKEARKFTSRMNDTTGDRIENIDTTSSLTKRGNKTTDKLILSSSDIAHIARIKKNITPMTLAEQRQIAQRERQRNTVLAILGVVALLLLLGASITAFIVRVPQRADYITTPTVSQVLPTATPTVDLSTYPTLATAYKGSMHDYLNGKTSSSYLEDIQQNKGKIQGICKCLGLIAPLNGIVDVDGSITFTVKMVGRGTNILFEGHIKTGGDIAGQFYIVNASNGQHTGEYGDWSFK